MNQVQLHDSAALDAWRRELRLEPHAVRRMRVAFFKKFLGREAALDELPPGVRRRAGTRVDFHPLQLERRVDSRQDGATKLVFRTGRGRFVESVLLRAGTGRVALCISSQVGCAADCDFCATGKMGFFGQLSAAEMLDQIVHAGELLQPQGRRIRNLVMMGMGEPFHNEPALYEALEALTAGDVFHHPPTRILVSTVGIPDAMLRCARRFPQVNQALSLHAVRQGVREQLIPLARKHSLESLRKALERLNQLQDNSVMIEYLMLAGVNDSLDEADELAEYLRGLRVHVNLIPYNRVEQAPHLAGSDRECREAFARVLKAAGYSTTIRYSMGADIDAACGQLVQRLQRQKRTPVSLR